jgi:hypothetical protein
MSLNLVLLNRLVRTFGRGHKHDELVVLGRTERTQDVDRLRSAEPDELVDRVDLVR